MPRPSPHRARNKLTPAKRDELLAAALPLPVALRCPPERSVSAFVLERLAAADGSLKTEVRSWLSDDGNRLLLQALLKAYRLHTKQNWPEANSIATFNNMTRQTLLGLQPGAPDDDKYSVSKRLRLLHSAKESGIASANAQISVAEASFRELCICDHYDGQPGPWYQLHLLYRLALKLEEFQVLDESPRAEADCPICQATVSAPGEAWHQLEPCRHWMCGSCATTYMLERGEHKCPQCRREVAIFVEGKSGT